MGMILCFHYHEHWLLFTGYTIYLYMKWDRNNKMNNCLAISQYEINYEVKRVVKKLEVFIPSTPSHPEISKQDYALSHYFLCIFITSFVLHLFIDSHIKCKLTF